LATSFKYIQKIEKDIDNDFKFLKSDIIDLIDLKELETAKVFCKKGSSLLSCFERNYTILECKFVYILHP